MEKTISIIEKLNTYEINKGKIVKRDGKYYIVMERHLHTFPDKRVIEKYIKKPEDEVYEVWWKVRYTIYSLNQR